MKNHVIFNILHDFCLDMDKTPIVADIRHLMEDTRQLMVDIRHRMVDIRHMMGDIKDPQIAADTLHSQVVVFDLKGWVLCVILGSEAKSNIFSVDRIA